MYNSKTLTKKKKGIEKKDSRHRSYVLKERNSKKKKENREKIK